MIGKKYFEKYIIGQALLSIAIVCLSYLVYLLMPSLDLIDLMREYRIDYQKTNDSILSILNIFEKFIDTSKEFVEFIKILFAIVLSIILITIQYLFYKQYTFQKTISNNSDEIKILSKTMIGIENTLEEHFEEYKVVRKYSSLHNSLLHHNFEEALRYDIDRIQELNSNDIYQSTVVLNDKYLDVIEENNLLKEYIETIIKQADKNIKTERIFIYQAPLPKNIYYHFNRLFDSNINVYLLEKDKLNTKQNFKELSENFIIINKEEIAFAYPFDGDFKFAINLLKSEEREVVRHLNSYIQYFDFMKNKSTVYIKKEEL